MGFKVVTKMTERVEDCVKYMKQSERSLCASRIIFVDEMRAKRAKNCHFEAGNLDKNAVENGGPLVYMYNICVFVNALRIPWLLPQFDTLRNILAIIVIAAYVMRCEKSVGCHKLFL